MLGFLNNIDQAVLLFIQANLHFKILDEIMIFATNAGSKGLIWVLISLLLLLNRRTRKIGIITLAALILSSILGEGLLKHIIQRPRPYDDLPWVHLLINKSTAYSFPSGHTASSFAAAYVLSKYLRSFSPIIWVVALSIALSRLYLFMHYPSDILGGIALGLLCGKLASYLYENNFNDKGSIEQ